MSRLFPLMSARIEAPTDAQLERDDETDERFAEMIHAAEWEDRAVPALADFEARP